MVVEAVSHSMASGALADPERFRAFYAAALPRVYAYLHRRCGSDRAIAEDLTQETFLAAVAEVRRGVVVADPVSWVLGIARHKLLDHFRRQRRTGWELVPWDDVEGDEVLIIAAEDFDLQRELAEAALAAVPSPQREALILRYQDGLSVPQIATMLGRSVGAAESLLVRGRIAFRRAYQEARHDA